MPHQENESLGDCERTPKSVLDNIPVVNQAFKSFPDYVGQDPAAPAELVVVSHCTKCGCPVYGPRSIPSEASIIGRNHISKATPQPSIVRTCACVYLQKDIKDTMHTK